MSTLSLERPQWAVIGGTGVYSMAGLSDVATLSVETPFGMPSDQIRIGTLEGNRVAFLARHGAGHHLLPTEVPYRANIWALKSLGVSQILAVSACGSLREDCHPGDLVVPDQLYDHTRQRAGSFFGEGAVAHIAFGEPFCPALRQQLVSASVAIGARVHNGGTYLIIEGPRFSSRGESEIFRQWPEVRVIGMTTAPEAALAREAEMCYAVLAHITDYDCWHVSSEAVTMEIVFQQLRANAQQVEMAIREAIRAMGKRAENGAGCGCGHALDTALATPWPAIPSATRSKLAPILARLATRKTL